MFKKPFCYLGEKVDSGKGRRFIRAKSEDILGNGRLVDKVEKHSRECVVKSGPYSPEITQLSPEGEEPIEVRKSKNNNISHLYYIIKTELRLFCVVLKVCSDGNYISTAYTTTKIKNGEIIYKKDN